MPSFEGSVDGQALLGRDCAWCGEPAVAEIEIQPARYRKVKVNPRVYADEVAQFAITTYVCDAHRGTVKNQPPPMKNPRTTKDKTAEQTTIFDMPGVGDAPSARNAIFGDGR